ncbi:transcriptional regulator, partial [Helicobacter suis]
KGSLGMWYVLKNKDKEVVRFKLQVKEQVINDVKIKDYFIDDASIVLQPTLLPRSFDDYKSVTDNVEHWIRARKIPKNRAFVKEITKSLQLNPDNFLSYVDVTLALSLNDTYWIAPADKNYLWKDYNLYENSFNETLALVAFAGHSAKLEGLVTSPELTTNGMLKKCWRKNTVSGNIELLKGWSILGHNEYGKEPYCEYYMAQIAATLGFEHVHYDLQKFHGEIVSSCELFTNQQYGYLPMYYCLDKKTRIRKNDTATYLASMTKLYGEDAFYDLLLFDALTFNTDRHLGNFGMLIDNDTNEFVKPAPIFDNGMAFFNHITEYDLDNIPAYFTDEHSALGISFSRQLEIACQPRHIELLSKLAKFTFTRHEKYNLSEKWLQAGEKFIQQRSQEIIQIIAKKQAKSQETPLHSQTFPTPPTPQHKEPPTPSKRRRR